MFIDTTSRSTQVEIMDDLEMEGELLRRSLDTLDSINKWLGGNQVTLKGLDTLLRQLPMDKTIKIVDIGCGSGDMLRLVADKMRKAGRKVEILGIDANAFTVNYARKKSLKYPEISYLCESIPYAGFFDLEYDILLSTLFLHHLESPKIVEFLKKSTPKISTGIIVNDLHRSQWAYFLFNILTFFVPNRMIRQDGLTSILKGFKKTDLQNFSKQLHFTNSSIKWCWAFRYQWIVQLQKTKPT